VKHTGKALKAALRLMGLALVILGLLAFALKLTGADPRQTSLAMITPFVLFSAFTLYFFRDPTAAVPAGPALVVAPAHGKVDVIDEIDEPAVMRGRCRRISIFLSVVDVHVQQAPVAGEVTLVKHTPGQFLNAMRTDCAEHNENVLVGFRATEPACGPVGVRLIAGLIARRIVPWAATGDQVAKGERISLIQFGSRVDLYLPLAAEPAVQLGQRVVGGETVMARMKA
jgi:phosphatidylserine decarboxylase